MPAKTLEQIVSMVQKALRQNSIMSYVPDDAIIFTDVKDRDTLPTFKTYLVRISAPDSGFIIKEPRIGHVIRYTYVLAIELWVKSGFSVADRLTKGNPSALKGIYEFFGDVNGILEHNTFDGQLDPYPGVCVTTPTSINAGDRLTNGVIFFWYGNQDVLS